VNIRVLALALAFSCSVQAADRTLILGVFPRFSATETTKRYSPLADYLAARLNAEITLSTARDFQSFMRTLSEQRYDIVQYNQYHYIRSSKNYQVIAHNKEFGKSTIAGVLYVRKDSGITDLKQLKGATVLFGGGEDAMIGYIAPMYMLLQAGLTKHDFTSQFAVTPMNSVIGVYHRQADAAGSGDGVIDQPAIKKSIDPQELVALAISEQLLHLPWAVRRAMPARLRDAVQAALVELENTESGREVLNAALLSGIGKANDRDYDPARKMVKAVMSAH
jgi:phosphonate transport system substrate-binding protein